ncbi:MULTISPECIES: hypothetical protein [unclassified Streptomyces]|uniref:hypothetical protein n=1 Tax=unclassified Streptomyces TaxID=2593676 RepID=UPI002DD82C70|nr:hypothetical protein [Streptomyces sp. NBC_00151]WRZ44149.1 hypothetical protein OG915_42570 [Streptomyces sp. NBC_00151]
MKILRDCRQKGDSLHHAVRAVATCHRRLHGEIGRIPPAEYETNYYRETTKPQVTVKI